MTQTTFLNKHTLNIFYSKPMLIGCLCNRCLDVRGASVKLHGPGHEPAVEGRVV